MKNLNKHFKLCWGKYFLVLLLITMISKTGISQTNLYVDANVSSTGNGLSWSTSFKTLREALSTANAGTGKYTINMAQGTYYPTTNATTIATSRDSSFCIFRKGISILGGYPAGGGTRNSKQYVTKISGDIGVTGVNTDNAHHVLTIIIQTNTADSLTIDGVNIEGGNANGSGTYTYNGVALQRNTGGGIYINNTGSSTINNVYITNSLIQNSSASMDGGGIENYNCTLIILGSFIANNNCINYGAGLNNEAGGSLILANTCFVNNINSSGFGGGLRVSGSSTNDVINCTFTNNSAPSGGAIRVASLGTATVRIYNSIFRSNKTGTDSISSEADVSNGSILSIYSSNLQSTQTCTSCLTPNTNPLLANINNPLGNDGFFGTADDGLKLTSSSPCRDAGNNTYIVGYPIDITGAQRIQNTSIDLGPYEFGALMSIVTSGAFSKMNACTGSASAPNSFLVSGTALNSNVLVTPPTGFEVSTNATTGYASSLTLNISAQTLVATTVYVRVTSTATGVLSGNITISSTGAPSQLLAINGESTSCTVIAGDTSLKSVAPGFSYVVDASLTISSVSTIPGANVTIISGKQTSDTLTYTGTLPSGVTASYSATTGVLTFTGNATAALYQTLLRTVTFKSLISSASVVRNIAFTLGNSVPLNGHYYEYVATSSITWTSAKTAASSRNLFGMQGYLTTVSNTNENTFIAQKLISDAWMGASDEYTQINAATGVTTYANQTTAEGNWFWVTGPEKGTKFSVGNYPSSVAQAGQFMNWANIQPDNFNNLEHYGQFYSSSTPAGKWNDLKNNDPINGYICEYGGMAGDPTNLILSYSRNILTAAAVAASLTTASPTLVTSNSATLGGNVTNDGGATVTERGVVYATTANPTTTNTKVSNGAGLGTFSQNITGLTAATLYHVRAYAINSAGTSYGADSTFTTLTAGPPTVLAGDTSAKTTTMGNAVVVDNSLTITGSSTVPGANVTITSGLLSGDSLAYTGTLPTGVTTSYNASKGVLVFNGNATPAEYQALLRTVTFKTNSVTSATTRRISFTLGTAVPYNGHFYEFVATTGTWTASKNAANARTYFGLQGYLVTIADSLENSYVFQKLSSDAWMGASDEFSEINAATGTTTYANQTAAEGNWYWVTGPEKGTKFSVGNYPSVVVQPGKFMNWATVEPNNSGGEHYAQFYSSNLGKWNDLANSMSIGFVCEYGGMVGDPTVSLSYARNILPVQVNLATIITASATIVTSNSATLGGNVTADGGATVTERGVVYATAVNPTTANTKVSIGTGLGAFSQNITGLTAATTYHVRAYAINSVGTSYGADSTFTTLNAITLATVSTASPTLIGANYATLGGNVITDGGATVTEKGVVFATTANPTTANNKVNIGTGIGTFNQIVSALLPNTTYHVRAYAINSIGTNYGGDSLFTTLTAPVVSEKPFNTITPNGDGTNDTWEIDFANELKDHEIVVYNILGQEVYRSVGYDKAWDGKKDGNALPSAEYYYFISGSKHNLKGALLLLSK